MRLERRMLEMPPPLVRPRMTHRFLFQKKTVDRLLKKQDSRGTKTGSRPKEPKMSAPTLTYLNNREGIYLSFPVAMETNPIVPLVQK